MLRYRLKKTIKSRGDLFLKGSTYNKDTVPAVILSMLDSGLVEILRESFLKPESPKLEADIQEIRAPIKASWTSKKAASLKK
ncbi:hypothetical protein COW49_00475 [Candidatus Kaiserbacteria bacterium CG17_big_fil_post_rev_8_21_14_2_50_51_7]|uniref:Uncharacterized protein n=1 Tax=Candidatus Kaiserbacteria bacterium CG17_big_fil_post_rev_8_21_14_2_50_51_7 TaxID=1974613 RepID=A0A2M7FE60_9BACT|nr:MAG: hypothetical protein COW49_00475 [Candidatus Kaiserbacteria bacterium CG17_big_fil_post_rev_8_21_14_2_50_51_7]